MNRLEGIDYPGTDQDVSYTYDEGTHGKGRLTHVIDASGRTDYSYNALGQVTVKTETLPGATSSSSDDIVQVTAYHYSAEGVLEKTVYPGGLEITAASDAGKITSLSDTSGSPDLPLVSNIAYRGFGGGITGWQTESSGIDRYLRTFDANGRITGIGVGDNSESAYTGLEYDAYGNISAARDIRGNSADDELYEYDVSSRLAKVTSHYGRISYSYDAVGNRTGLLYERKDPATQTWDEFYTEAYSISSGSNRLQGITRSQNASTVRTRSFAYDARGNIKTDTRQKTGDTAKVNSLNYGNSDRLDSIDGQ